MRFLVHVLQGHVEWAGPSRDDLSWYTHRAIGRFSKHGWQCEIRVSTCRAWTRTNGNVAFYDLGWSEDSPPDEDPLGRFDCSAPPAIVEKVEAEWRQGHAVWLFMFNADSRRLF